MTFHRLKSLMPIAALAVACGLGSCVNDLDISPINHRPTPYSHKTRCTIKYMPLSVLPASKVRQEAAMWQAWTKAATLPSTA